MSQNPDSDTSAEPSTGTVPGDEAASAATAAVPAADGTHAAADADRINSTVRWTMYSVFAAREAVADPETAVKDVGAMVADLADRDLVVRGWYDVAGMRADADVMVWWHAPEVETLQEAYRRLRRTALGAALAPVWSAVGIHRPAEFNRGHVPAFMAGRSRGGT